MTRAMLVEARPDPTESTSSQNHRVTHRRGETIPDMVTGISKARNQTETGHNDTH